MKDFFKRAAAKLDELFFIPPQLDLSKGEKRFLQRNGYQVVRSKMPIAMGIHMVGGMATIDYDLIKFKDGSDLTSKDYDVALDLLSQYKDVPPPEYFP